LLWLGGSDGIKVKNDVATYLPIIVGFGTHVSTVLFMELFRQALRGMQWSKLPFMALISYPMEIGGQ
jgi:hypothetical protein